MIKRTTSAVLDVRVVLAAILLIQHSASAATLYAEPGDLSDDIALPTDVGTLAPGVNTVSGGVSGTWVPFDQFSGNWVGDVTDAFEYTVPLGMTVSTFEMIISNFSTTNASTFGEAVSTSLGVDTPFFGGDSIFFDLLNGDALLSDFTYNYGLQIANTCPGCFGGTLSFDWEVNLDLYVNGDLNDDDYVGIADLNTVLANWNTQVTPGSLTDGDPSGDGFVGIDDLNEVLGNWNNGIPPATQVSIPEPAAAGLLMMGLAGIVGRRVV